MHLHQATNKTVIKTEVHRRDKAVLTSILTEEKKKKKRESQDTFSR